MQIAKCTPIPIKIAPVKHDTWSMFPAVHCDRTFLQAGFSALCTLIGGMKIIKLCSKVEGGIGILGFAVLAIF